MKKTVIAAFITMILGSCTSIHFHGNGTPPSHDAWTGLVKKYVNADGLVDYKGFISDSGKLNSYLELLSSNPPGKEWSDNDKIAYWLNAYNAFTVKLIIEHYPLKSIKDLGPKDQVIFINTPWDIKFFEIGGKTMTLNRIEHRILRKDFTEPRIHFALNCASMSCPKLRREAYVGSKLDEQLTDQAKDFLRDESRNKISASSPKVSSIFKFYGSDMTKWSGKSLIGYINQYSPVQINADAELQYLDYDWSLNKQ
ncbi:MAG: DUF547 domain-containing protein [Chitinophagaceae bacterium]